jgi:hypothetical protein
MEEQINLNNLHLDLLIAPQIQEDALFLEEATKRAKFVMKDLDLSKTSLVKEELEALTKDSAETKMPRDEYLKRAWASIQQKRQKEEGNNRAGSVSLYELQRYNDPNIKFTPNADMEEIYAAAHPATFSRAVAKAYETGKATLFYGLNNTIQNIKRLGSGELPSLFGNEEAKGMADAFLKAETENPLYYSKDDGAVKRFALDTVAASGSVVSSIVDGLASSALVTLAGSAVGSPEIGLAGLASKVKNAYQFKKAIKGMRTASEQLTRARKIKGLSDLGRTALTTHLTITGEASLQAELNKRDFLEKALEEYKTKNGVQASGKDLEDIHAAASQVENSTYGLNMVLVGASTLMQFPALMKGKVTNTFSAGSLFKIVDGKAVAKSIKSIVAKDFFVSGLSEGGEEYFQSVVDSSTQSYFKKKLNKENRNYLEEFLKSTFQPEEGAFREFLIGAVLGGGTSLIKNIPASLKAKEQRSLLLEGFNLNTEKVVEYLRTEIDTNKKLQSTDDPKEIDNIIDEKISNIAKVSYEMGTDENRRAYLEDLKKLSIENLQEELGIEVTEAERDTLIDNMLEQFDFTIQTMRDVNTVFRVNPLEEKWLNRAYKKLMNNTTGTKMGLSNQLFSTFKNIYVDAILKNKSLGTRLTELQDEISLHTTIDGTDLIVSIPNLFSTILSDPSNLQKSIDSFITQLQESATLPSTIKGGKVLFDASTKKLIEKLEKLDSTNIYTKLATILQHYKVSEDSAEKIKEYISTYNSKKLFENEIEGFNTPSEQRKIFNEIQQYLEYVVNTLEEDEAKIKEKEDLKAAKATGQPTAKATTKAQTTPTKPAAAKTATAKTPPKKGDTAKSTKAVETQVNKVRNAKTNNKMATQNKEKVESLDANSIAEATTAGRTGSSATFLNAFKNKVEC